MARESDTKEEILRTASRLLQQRGFNGFSFGHIAEELGVKPAAIHYHFKSKTDLGVALIHRFRTRYQLWMEDSANLPPTERIRGYFGIFRRFLQDGKVCPGGALLTEHASIPEEMQREVRAMASEINRWIAAILDQGRKSGELHFRGSPEAKATVLASALQGALQTARTLGREYFETAAGQLELELTDDSVRKGAKGS